MKKEIYLAGGCFWGMEKLYSMLNGVIEVKSGYVNGYNDNKPTYEEVCYKMTGFKEAVHIRYDSEIISLERLLFVFFSVINPTTPSRQGVDKGYQYQAGIYYVDEESKNIIQKIIDIEKTIYTPFSVEFEEMKNYYDAEDYHQKYLEKNPNGYCHINPTRMSILANYNILPEEYIKPAVQILKIKL
ncbi:MAG: peptide-methionine (S)-S-oxide reductase MsrA [Eubacteriales bacterium]|nr:peptide-methionine (S)-S-oxide reductase MsrA [Eubacteriales bacterium]MDY3332633.1 peptide-methionine (S)-S-oxide reductase MsrA [Gallibacter sp.]